MSGFDCPWWLRPLLWLRSLFGGIALLALPFVGCRPPQVILQRVEVPVPTPCPEPPRLEWPDLPIYHLPPEPAAPLANASAEALLAHVKAMAVWRTTVARAYASSVERLQGQLWQAFLLLDGYRTTTPAAAPKTQPGSATR